MKPVRNQRERGNAVVEFALVIMFLVPLLMGTFTVGMSLGRTIQVTQVARDAGHMYARWVDFSLPGNKDLVVRLASGLGMTRDGGTGVVYFSKVTYIGELECTSAGLSISECPNYDQYVIVQRQSVGNTALFESRLGTPSQGTMDSSGNVIDVLRTTSAQVQNWSQTTGIVLTPGKYAFVVEACFQNRTYSLTGGVQVDPIYVRLYY